MVLTILLAFFCTPLFAGQSIEDMCEECKKAGCPQDCPTVAPAVIEKEVIKEVEKLVEVPVTRTVTVEKLVPVTVETEPEGYWVGEIGGVYHNVWGAKAGAGYHFRNGHRITAAAIWMNVDDIANAFDAQTVECPRYSKCRPPVTIDCSAAALGRDFNDWGAEVSYSFPLMAPVRGFKKVFGIGN